MQVKYYILFLIAFVLTAIRTDAQTVVENELFYHIGEKDGLADNQVTCFYQYRGVMWMGTQYGLNSFDGSEIRTWKSGNPASPHQLVVFDHKFGLIKDYTPAIKALGGPYNADGLAVMNITPRRSNEYWLSTSSGVLKLNSVTGKVSVVCNNMTDSTGRRTLSTM